MYIPNTFTPNGDEINDVWGVQGQCIEEVQCSMFNRWGEEIASWSDITFAWDGNYNGGPVQDGIYAYVVRTKTYDGVRTIHRGHVTVLR